MQTPFSLRIVDKSNWIGKALVFPRALLEGSVTNGRMQEITGEHSKDITVVLQALVRDGLLIQQNQRRWASYRVAGDSLHNEVDSPHNGVMKAGDSPHNEVDSPHNGVMKAGNSPHNGVVEAENSPHKHPELLSLAAPAREKARLAPEVMRSLILRLCQTRWLTSTELAALLNRDAEKLQARFLTAMVKTGQLELRHPNVPNRPDQAYRTKE